MSAQLHVVDSPFPHIPLQDASADIWDSKYRLKTKAGAAVDATVDATYQRVARALADVEADAATRDQCYHDFLWALRHGAIPAGRIISNAGALEHKPATSTINCTVSGVVNDSMDDILRKVHEAGLTLKAGCGIGYEFSTLRPKGAYVSGAGAHTSGPLSFMDIYDKMCFTISSAGGRRGAQMATFDVSHPDVVEFIRAKREDGRLRQFNLSLLITREFVEAVKHNRPWRLSFPVTAKEAQADGLDLADPELVVWREFPVTDGYIVNDAGLVACRIAKTIPAPRLWDIIMSSTYDYAEPGFILIDKVNDMNNNWWCEKIRATNPCVTADTRLHTQYGLVRIGDLFRGGAALRATVDKRALGGRGPGVDTRPAKPAFMTAHSADVYRVRTEDGYEIKATAWHELYTARGKIKLKDLKAGDRLLIQSGKGQFGQMGDKGLGALLGLVTGSGQGAQRDKRQRAALAAITAWTDGHGLAPRLAACIGQLANGGGLGRDGRSARQARAAAAPQAGPLMRRSVMLAYLFELCGLSQAGQSRVPEVVWQGCEDCVTGYLSALFQVAGGVDISADGQSCAVRLASPAMPLLQEVQTLLANFGIVCRIGGRRDGEARPVADGGGPDDQAGRPAYGLVIDGQSRERFMREIGFMAADHDRTYQAWAAGRPPAAAQDYSSAISAIEHLGAEAVFDTTQPDHNTVIFNGLVSGQCGEQPLPPYGSCLLGSINLTGFVRQPFTKDARFDWAAYRKVVRVFTRMLDNVVELNGLPLARQQEEITGKRRHGMGYLGLGSAITMLNMRYGDEPSVKFTEEVTKALAVEGWKAALELAREKGPAPIMGQMFTVTGEMLRLRPEMAADGHKVGDELPGRVLHAKYSRYMRQLAEEAPELVEALAEVGARFTHHSSIAPTGTISLSLANNASNGIEPSFAHRYARNVIRPGKKTKEKVDVYSYEALAWRHLTGSDELPANFITADDVTPKQHVDIQAAAQKWVDSSISKTANVPTDYPYEAFKDIYLYAYEQGLKGCTTFRFNPQAFQGVLVKESDLENTTYQFTLADGHVLECKGNDEIEYDGETHTAANLFEALKEGYYGKF